MKGKKRSVSGIVCFLLFFVLVLTKGSKRICCHYAAFLKIYDVCSRRGLSLIAAFVHFLSLRFFYFYLDSKQLPLFDQRPFLRIYIFLKKEVLTTLGESALIFKKFCF